MSLKYHTCTLSMHEDITSSNITRPTFLLPPINKKNTFSMTPWRCNHQFDFVLFRGGMGGKADMIAGIYVQSFGAGLLWYGQRNL